MSKTLFPRFEAWAAVNAGLLVLFWWLSLVGCFAEVIHQVWRLSDRVSVLEECE